MVSSTNLSNSTFFVSAKSPSPPQASPERSLPGTVGIKTIYPLAMSSNQQQLSDEEVCMQLMDFMMQCVSSQVRIHGVINKSYKILIVVFSSYMYKYNTLL